MKFKIFLRIPDHLPSCLGDKLTMRDILRLDLSEADVEALKSNLITIPDASVFGVDLDYHTALRGYKEIGWFDEVPFEYVRVEDPHDVEGLFRLVIEDHQAKWVFDPQKGLEYVLGILDEED